MTDALRAAAWTALFSFVTLFGASVAGWLQDVAAWASSSGRAPLPGLSVLGYGLVAAAASAAIGLVNFIVRAAQARGVLPGRPPRYGPHTGPSPRDERGLSEIAELTLLVGAGFAVAAITLILT